jgi:Zn-dependent protease
MGMLYRINLWWGLINLLPVLPLDGGRVCQSFLELCRQSNPLRTAIQVSVVISACAAFVFFAKFNERFAGMLFAMLCLQNLASLQDPHAR